MILTVQPCGNKRYRLGINAADSNKYFKCRGVKVRLVLTNNQIIDTKTSCGTPCDKDGNRLSGYKKGFDLYHKALHKWILDNDFNCYSKGYPTKLKFEFLDSDDGITLKFIDIHI